MSPSQVRSEVDVGQRSLRHQILNPEQRQRLFDIPISPAELAKHYTLTKRDQKLVAEKRRDENRLGFAIQLCLCRYPGRPLNPDETLPHIMVKFVAQQLNVAPDVFPKYALRDQTRRAHALEVQELYGLRAAKMADWRQLLAVAANTAWATECGEAIVCSMQTFLRNSSILMPTAPMLERIAIAGRVKARNRTFEALTADLSEARLQALDQLVAVDPEGKPCRAAWLKAYPESPGPRNLIKLLDRLDALRELGIDVQRAQAIHPIRFDSLVYQGIRMTAQNIATADHLRRRALLVALAIDLQATIIDASLGMFEKFMGSIFTKAKNKDGERFKATKQDVARMLILCRKIIEAVLESGNTGEDVHSRLDREIGIDALRNALPVIDSVTTVADDDILSIAAERYGILRRLAPRFLEAFEFESNTADDPLLAALELLKKHGPGSREPFPNRPPSSFLPKKWRKLIFADGRADLRLYYTATLSVLRDGLRSSNIWVSGSRKYRALEQMLLPQTAPQIVAADIGNDMHCDTYLARRRAALEERLAFVAHGLERNTLEGVKLDQDGLVVAKLRDSVPPEAIKLGNRLYAMIPRVRITDVMMEVDARTGFSAKFIDQRTGSPPTDKAALLAAVLADGTNLSLSRMAQASKIPHHRLLHIAQWHISSSTYEAAAAAVNAAHRRLPIVTMWGDGTTSSSDGQFFRAGRNAGGTINAKYGMEPGFLAYTFVSDQYDPFHTRIITATTSEAPFVLDGLLRHEQMSGLTIKEHYTDTAGATEHTFALAHLLGFGFAPRIRDLKDRKLFLLEKPTAFPILGPLVGGIADTNTMRHQWGEFMRLAISLKSGSEATPSEFLRKLGAAGPTNVLSRGLLGLGRLERAQFTLNWISDPKLRQRSTGGLNKGESEHALRRALFFNREGEFRDRTLDNQSFRASGLNLLVAIIVYWNSVYLAEAVNHARSQNESVPDNLLSHVAPLGWEHIGLTGDYVWVQRTPPGQLRLLRDSDEPFLQIAA